MGGGKPLSIRCAGKLAAACSIGPYSFEVDNPKSATNPNGPRIQWEDSRRRLCHHFHFGFPCRSSRMLRPPSACLSLTILLIVCSQLPPPARAVAPPADDPVAELIKALS